MFVKASKGPSLLVEHEEITKSDVEDHFGLQVQYSSENPSFMDCEAKEAKRQGIAPPNDTIMDEGFDVEGAGSFVPTLNAAMVGSSVASLTSKVDRCQKKQTKGLRKRKRNQSFRTKCPKTSHILTIPSRSQKGGSELSESEPIDSALKSDLGAIPEQKIMNILDVDPSVSARDKTIPTSSY
ncbi:hypothetical protein QYF36_023091 [Acer negundo]|nr:hypothetical protein QYF36_023091 [Acer negundo]